MDQSEESIFHEALSQDSAAARDAYLTQACEGRSEILASVRSLLAAYPQGELLEQTLLPEPLRASLAASNSADAVIGPYHVRELIGRGGMGTVYMAEQLQPVQRKVAIKIIRPGLDSHDVVRRFHQEQRTLAMMDHPNIARVLDASVTPSGISYFVMELVNGVPILAFCEQQQSPVEQRLRLFADCCQAIQHAHQKGIIHRDIKPSNVLVTLQDGQPVVKVIDFGIAKALTSDNPDPVSTGNTFATRFGEFLGTPQYMSPEQAAMDGIALDTRTDIYSLGAMLYAILTGVPPFDSERLRQSTFDQIRQIVREEDPRPPSVRVHLQSQADETPGSGGHSSTRRRLSLRLSGDLDCIVMKAMMKDRDRRYQTVSDFAEDVQSFLDNKPIQARAPTLLYSLWKMTQRHRSLVLATVAAVLCLLVGAAAAFVQANRASKAEVVANRERDAAVAARHSMAQLLYASDLRLASEATLKQDSVTANTALQRQVPKPGEPDLRSFDWHFLAAGNKVETQELFKSEKALYHLCRISGSSWLACCGADGMIRIFDEPTGRLLQTIPAQQGEVNGLASSPDGKTLASAGDDGTVAFWDAATGVEKDRFQACVRQVFQVAYSNDGLRIATCGNEPGVKIRTVSDHALLCEIPSGGRDLECLAVSVNDDLAFGAEGGIVTLTKIPASFGEVPVLRTYADQLEEHCGALAFSPDGQFLASGKDSGTVRVLAIARDEPVLKHTFLLSDVIGSLVFSADGTTLVAGSHDGAVTLLNLRPIQAAGLSLIVRDSLTDVSGNVFDGNEDGVEGGDWHSTQLSEPELQKSDTSLTVDGGVSISSADPPPRLIRTVPAAVNGVFPPDIRTLTLEFSELLANAHNPDHFEFHLRSGSALDDSTKVVFPALVTADGPVVTLSLSDTSGGLIRQTGGMPSKPALRSWLLHEGSIASVLPSQQSDAAVSVGADGRLIRIADQRQAAVKLVAGDSHAGQFAGDGRLLLQNRRTEQVYYASARITEPSVEQQPDRLNSPRMWTPTLARGIGIVFAIRRDETFQTEIRQWSRDLADSVVVWKAGENERSMRWSVSSDGRFLAVEVEQLRDGQSTDQSEIEVWDLNSKKCLSRQSCKTVYRIVFSPDHSMLAVTHHEDVDLCEPDTGRLMRILPVPSVTNIAFSPDGRELATVSNDRALRIFRVADGAELHSLQAHGVAAIDVAYTPDGKTIGTVGFDGLFRCWRRDGMQMTLEFPFSDQLISLEFSPVGTQAVIADHSGHVFLLTTGESVDRVK